MTSDVTSPNLDDLLMDIATAIELSDHDRRIVENRYRRLKQHLERRGSPLAPYLIDGESRIYPQGSIAAGTTVVSGREHDRFDLDALVELNVPPAWTPKQTMDLLYDALKDFPDAVKVIRCTRCIQIQFAFMHMDVTVMDPQKGARIERAGEIFHSPDKGPEARVPANPYGFSQWFRQNVQPGNIQLATAMAERRRVFAIDRLSLGIAAMDAAEQDDLPEVLPPHLDSEQVVALKLIKRYLNLCYEEREIRRPPPIYISKLTVDIGPSPYGLCAQLAALAEHVRAEMNRYIVGGQMPDERNPTYQPDRLNDRWPENQNDMRVLAGDMDHLLGALKKARTAEFSEIAKIFADLFGEKISSRSVETLLKRAADGGIETGGRYERGTGTVLLADAVLAPAIIRSVSSTPRHNFHCGIKKKKE